ncbi:MAG: Inner spore coat protein, partial [Verrucomicrobiota bacterium]
MTELSSDSRPFRRGECYDGSMHHLRTTFALLLLCSGFLSIRTATAGIVISEIMYHPPGTNVLEEWLELHNTGSNSVNLGGWQLDRGVHFTFPKPTVMLPDARLVVAADADTFRALHPGLGGFLAGWAGSLRDNGETVGLVDAAGQTVAEVAYAAEGDWATRRLSAPDRYGRAGWIWVAEHNGLGRSLELINPALPNGLPHNWTSSAVAGGTPGRPNSVESRNLAPLVVEAGHFPLIPTQNDPVTLHVRLLDERTTGLSAALLHREDGTAPFTATSMGDDGKHGDGLPGDGLFAVQLPARPNGTVVEFYFEVVDAEGHARTYPAVIPSGSDRTAHFLYQVDDEPFSGPQPLYRLIMNRAETEYLRQTWRDEPDSDAEVNGTFIGLDAQVREGATAQVRYTSSFRNRGHGTRVSVPHNFRVNFPKDRPWQGREGINLNTQFTQSQVFGSMLMRRAGLPMAEARAVQVRISGEDLAGTGSPQFGAYAGNELVDDSLVERQFPGDPDGNLYRGIRDVYPGNPRADLVWHGPDASSYTNAYFKRNHVTEDDWSDLVHLLDVLNNTPDANWDTAVAQVADVGEWMRYFALNTLMGNQETTLATGYGDDFALYRGVLDTRFRLLGYDMDSVLGSGTRTTTYSDGIFKMFGSGSHRIPVLEQLLKHPSFAPVYYRELKTLADTLFAPEQMNPLLDQLAAGFASGEAITAAIANMKAFNASQRAHVLGEIPMRVSVSDGLPVVSGYPRTTTPTIPLSGRAQAIDTRSIRVNGTPATWSAWDANWIAPAVSLHPGINRVLIQALDGSGKEVERTTHDVWYDDGNEARVVGTVAADAIWSAQLGPYHITGDLTIANGVTLTVEAGTTVYLDSGAHLTVSSGGRLLTEGLEAAPIRFTRPPGTTATWGGIVINGGPGSPENQMSHTRIEFNGSTAIEVAGGTVRLDHLTFGNTDRQYL